MRKHKILKKTKYYIAMEGNHGGNCRTHECFTEGA